MHSRTPITHTDKSTGPYAFMHLYEYAYTTVDVDIDGQQGPCHDRRNEPVSQSLSEPYGAYGALPHAAVAHCRAKASVR